MSDMSQGPGWWIASDGKWYPPHLHPAVQQPAAVPEHPAPTEADPDAAPRWSISAAAEFAAVQEQYGDAAIGHPASVAGDEGGVALGGVGLGSTDFATADFGVVASPKAHRPSRTRGRAIVGSVVAVLLVTTGLVAVFGGANNANAEVVDAVSGALARNSAHLTITMAGSAAGTSLQATGTGSIDFAHNALELQMSEEESGQQVTIQALYVDGVMYLGSPQLDQVIPGKSWLSIDLSSLQKAAGVAPAGGLGGLGNDPAVELQMLAQEGNTVVPTGPSTIDGVAVQGYSVQISAATVANELKNADLPAWLRQAASQVKTQDTTMDVFVDQAGLLRAVRMHVQETLGSDTSSDVTMTIGLSDYGAPVTIAAPPPDQVESFPQFLQSAMSQAEASSST